MMRRRRDLVYYITFFAVSLCAFLPWPFIEDLFPSEQRMRLFLEYGSPLGKWLVDLLLVFGFLYFVSGFVVGIGNILRHGKLGFLVRRVVKSTLVSIVVCGGVLFCFVVVFSKFDFFLTMNDISWELKSGGWEREFLDRSLSLKENDKHYGSQSLVERFFGFLNIHTGNIFYFVYQQNYFVMLIFFLALMSANVWIKRREESSFYAVWFALFSVLTRIFKVLYRVGSYGTLLIVAYFFSFYMTQIEDGGRLIEEVLPTFGLTMVLPVFLGGCILFVWTTLLLKKDWWKGLSLYFETLTLSIIPRGTELILFRIAEHLGCFSQRHKHALTASLFFEGIVFHYGKFLSGGILFAFMLKFYMLDPSEHFFIVLLFGLVCGAFPLYFRGISAGIGLLFLSEFFWIDDQGSTLLIIPLSIVFAPVASFVNGAVLLFKNVLLMRAFQKYFVAVDLVVNEKQEDLLSERKFRQKRYTYTIPFKWLSLNIPVLVIVYAGIVSYIFYHQLSKSTDATVSNLTKSHRGIIKHVSQSISGQIRDQLHNIQQELDTIMQNKSINRRSINSQALLLELYDRILKEYPAVRYVAITHSNGITDMLKRLPKDSFKILNASFQKHNILTIKKIEDQKESFVTDEDIVYIQQNKVFANDPCHTNKDFNTRVQWSDPHWFPLEFQFGMLACGDFTKVSRGKIGYIKVGIRFEDISNILKSKLPDNFESYIFDSQSSLLASSYKYRTWHKIKSHNLSENDPKKQEPYALMAVKEYPEKDIKLLHANYSHNKSSVYEYHKGGKIAFITDFTVKPNLLWNIAVLSFVDIDKVGDGGWYISVLISGWLLIILIWLIQVFFNKIDHSFSYINTAIKQIRSLDFHTEKKQSSLFMIKELETIRGAFTDVKTILQVIKRYIPASLLPHLTRLESSQVKLGGVKREIAVLFTDIADFTSISEKTSIEELLQNLSIYFTYAEQIIHTGNGTIDKYIGDAIMAFWGAPDRIENHSYKACISAIDCQHKFQEIIQKKALTIPFHTRMGIHTDSVIVGNIGSLNRLNYTSIGDGVNLASRIEGLNKVYGTSIMITQAVKDQVENQLEYRLIDKVTVKGKEQGTQVYQLLGKKGEYSLLKTHEPLSAIMIESFLSLYEHALSLYFKGDFEASLNTFTQAQKLNPIDKATDILIQRCNSLIQTPPSNWTGVYQVQTK